MVKFNTVKRQLVLHQPNSLASVPMSLSKEEKEQTQGLQILTKM